MYRSRLRSLAFKRTNPPTAPSAAKPADPVRRAVTAMLGAAADSERQNRARPLSSPAVPCPKEMLSADRSPKMDFVVVALRHTKQFHLALSNAIGKEQCRTRAEADHRVAIDPIDLLGVPDNSSG